MVHFIGTYNCKADAKGRVMLPVILKNQLTPILNNGFVIKRSMFQPCLELYPMEEWNVVMGEMSKKNRFEKINNDFFRIFSAGVTPIDIDSTGRLLIPKNLADFAGISKEVVLSSSIGILEIWDKDSYEKAIDVDPAEVAKMAEMAMGGKSVEE